MQRYQTAVCNTALPGDKIYEVTKYGFAVIMYQLPAFANLTMLVRQELCTVMVFTVERAGTIVLNDGEEVSRGFCHLESLRVSDTQRKPPSCFSLLKTHQ